MLTDFAFGLSLSFIAKASLSRLLCKMYSFSRGLLSIASLYILHFVHWFFFLGLKKDNLGSKLLKTDLFKASFTAVVFAFMQFSWYSLHYINI